MSVEGFLKEVELEVEKQFTNAHIEYILRTPKSLKCNVYIRTTLFIAIRYNNRNERTDIALIREGKRIFGYDNLKKWHYHPYENPEQHIACEKPAMEKVIFECRDIVEKIR